ncbi:MAG: FeoB-associated Cys-rich membrane protein [Clostridia bacterium]|nr:FeoB-associated Cys-rich membrane protein [Clostridia bacterium]MDE7084577.1 FeoB-associated Cys-rich membrane protein [Clostridia bacterium]MDE7256477.1 FeoB-associated Cys-rich membrane protein [Clostridia bacterium]
MGAFDIIVIVAVSVAFLAVVGVIIYKKVTKKGGGCGCGCEGCPHACNCGDAKQGKENKQ